VNKGRLYGIKSLYRSNLPDNNLQRQIYNYCRNRPGSQHCSITRNPAHLI